MSQSRLDRSGQSGIDLIIDAEQLKALKRAISDSAPAARKQLRTSLKDIGLKVRDEIRSRTPVYGGKYGGDGRKRVISRFGMSGNSLRTSKHTSGLLKRSTKIKMGRLSVEVYNDAKAAYKGGYYRYGKRLEFDPKFKGRYAFFYPGWEATKGEAGDEFKKVLDAAQREFVKK